MTLDGHSFTRGDVPGCLRPEITKILIKGHSNLAKTEGMKKENLPVTTKKLLQI